MVPGDKSWSAQQRGPGGRGLKVCYVIGLRSDGSQRQSTSGREGVGDRLPATYPTPRVLHRPPSHDGVTFYG